LRITYRKLANKKYWEKRWVDIPVDKPMGNVNIYPLKFSENLIKNSAGTILEAGCGNGRILRYYHNKGYNITGIDFIEAAVKKLKKLDPSLNVQVGDISKLKFEDKTFDYLLAFGLFHNLEKNLNEAIQESHRVLKKDGKICASFRADNIQNRLTDWLSNRKLKHTKDNSLVFHKMNLAASEFESLFQNNSFEVEKLYSVENMPILYKFRFFRSKEHKNFNESFGRNEGYRLSLFGKILQTVLMKYFPNQFCNIYVIIARKI